MMILMLGKCCIVLLVRMRSTGHNLGLSTGSPEVLYLAKSAQLYSLCQVVIILASRLVPDLVLTSIPSDPHSRQCCPPH